MPIHDWSRVGDGIFHDFHQDWIQNIKHALNGGILPGGYYALSDQSWNGVEPDVVALRAPDNGTPRRTDEAPAGEGVLLDRPKVRFTMEADDDRYVRAQSRIAIHDGESDDHELVAVVEILSRGNKSSRFRLERLLAKVFGLIDTRQIHVLIVDLHPPTSRDPQGIHGEIWRDLGQTPYAAPPDKPLTLASYEAAESATRAYIEPVAVGDILANMPLFLRPGAHVLVPLELTCTAAFSEVPRPWREALQKSD